MTDTTATRTPAEIRADLDAVAPLPQGDDAVALALHFAVRAQERWAGMTAPSGRGIDPEQVSLMCAEFAASHALRTLHRVSSGEANLAADQIAGALEDGGIVGEWLWDHLRTTADRITELAEELNSAVGGDVPVTVMSGDLKSVVTDAMQLAPSDPEAFDRLAEAAGLLNAAPAAEAVTGLTRDDLRSVLADAHRAGPSDPEAFNRAAAAAGLLAVPAAEAVASK
jgi:hypothetical protein